jgi:phosphatidylglycerol:prolipoprotein diacylglycerol transferase
MRQVLFRITFEAPWTFWGVDAATGQNIVGAAAFALMLAILHFGFVAITKKGTRQRWLFLGAVYGTLIVAASIAGLIASRAPQPVEWPTPPLYGYGFMILVGFLVGLWWAKRLAQRVGINPETITDTGTCLLITAVVGGRLEYLRQYGGRVFQNVQGPGDAIFRAINLKDGGLVLMGALAGGAIGVFFFAKARKLSPWLLLDVVMPSAFIGIGFGRLGCLLNGCCFGDPCSLPWGISFPAGSVPFLEIAHRGFLLETASGTMPLHPTQIYSSIDGFLLAIVTSLYFPLRRWNGELLCIAAMCYGMSRFLIEFLRWDEMGQIATTLTISQIYSIALFAVALAFWLAGQQRHASAAKSARIRSAAV